MNKFLLRRIMAAVVVLGVFLGVATGAFFFWLDNQGEAGGQPVKVSIENGSSGTDIATRLEKEGVIRSALAFRLFMRMNSSNEAFKAGEYQLRADMAFPQIVAELQKGPEVKFVRLPIPEGLNLEQTAAQVGKRTHITSEEFLAAATPQTVRPAILPTSSTTLEGFMYPTTYFVEERETAASLVRRLVEQSETQMEKLDFTQASSLGRSPYEILIIASMIEEEAKADEERTKMSAVIHNRLRQNIPLGIDATIQYAVRKYEGQPLRRSDLEIDSPFNTRTRTGLPPHPISSPRAGSIKAALNPSDDDYIFYVLGPDCVHHVFTNNSADFSRAKARQPDDC